MSQLLHPALNDVIKSENILVRTEMIINIAKRLKKEVKIPFGSIFSFGDGDGNIKIKLN